MSHYECKECHLHYWHCSCPEDNDKPWARIDKPIKTTKVNNMSHKITPTAAIVSDVTRVAHLEAALKEFHTTSKSLDDVLAEHHGACKPAVAAPEKTWAPAFTFREAGTILAVAETPRPVDANEAVHSPKHYMVIGDTEACDLIACMLGQYVKDKPNATPYQIYCAGNVFKYRLRAGEKDDLQQDIDKANKYKAMHNG